MFECREQDLKAAERSLNAFGRLWPFSTTERVYGKKAKKSVLAAG